MGDNPLDNFSNQHLADARPGKEVLNNSSPPKSEPRERLTKVEKKGQDIVNHIMQQDMSLSNPPPDLCAPSTSGRMQHFYQSGPQLRNIEWI